MILDSEMPMTRNVFNTLNGLLRLYPLQCDDENIKKAKYISIILKLSRRH